MSWINYFYYKIKFSCEMSTLNFIQHFRRTCLRTVPYRTVLDRTELIFKWGTLNIFPISHGISSTVLSNTVKYGTKSVRYGDKFGESAVFHLALISEGLYLSIFQYLVIFEINVDKARGIQNQKSLHGVVLEKNGLPTLFNSFRLPFYFMPKFFLCCRHVYGVGDWWYDL